MLAERRESRGKYIVLDGKQRLLSLLQFTGKSEGKNNAFTLNSLEIRTDPEKKRYSDLAEDVLLRDNLDAFHNETIRSVLIRNWPNIEFLHTVFLRLNTGSVSLSPQELSSGTFFLASLRTSSTRRRGLHRVACTREFLDSLNVRCCCRARPASGCAPGISYFASEHPERETQAARSVAQASGNTPSN